MNSALHSPILYHLAHHGLLKSPGLGSSGDISTNKLLALKNIRTTSAMTFVPRIVMPVHPLWMFCATTQTDACNNNKDKHVSTTITLKKVKCLRTYRLTVEDVLVVRMVASTVEMVDKSRAKAEHVVLNPASRLKVCPCVSSYVSACRKPAYAEAIMSACTSRRASEAFVATSNTAF